MKVLTLLLKKQVEILNSAIANAKDATTELSTGNPKDAAAKSIELTKKSIEDAQANVSNLVEIYEKNSNRNFRNLK